MAPFKPCTLVCRPPVATVSVKKHFKNAGEVIHDSPLLVPLQAKYSFKAVTYKAAGLADVKEYRAKHGSDLYITDMEAYDRICKVSLGPRRSGSTFGSSNGGI